MAKKEVPISASLTFGWETFKRNALFLVGLFFAVALMTAIVSAAAEYDAIEGTYASYIVEFIRTLVEMALQMGLIVIVLKLVDGESPEFADLFSRIRFVFHYFVAAVLTLFIVAFGLLLLVVPGVVWALRLSFFSYYIVEEGCGPLDAMQKSWDLTRGHVIGLLLLYLVVFAVNLAGILALVVGVFVSMPISNLMVAHVFRHLQSPGPDSEIQIVEKAA